MVKISKKLFFCMAFLFIFIIPFVNSFTATGAKSCAITTEACLTNTDCCEGLECREDSCNKIVDVENCINQEDDDGDRLLDCFDKDCKNNENCGGIERGIMGAIKQNNSATSALIIALGIIVGLIALGLILRKRK